MSMTFNEALKRVMHDAGALPVVRQAVWDAGCQTAYAQLAVKLGLHVALQHLQPTKLEELPKALADKVRAYMDAKADELAQELVNPPQAPVPPAAEPVEPEPEPKQPVQKEPEAKEPVNAPVPDLPNVAGEVVNEQSTQAAQEPATDTGLAE